MTPNEPHQNDLGDWVCEHGTAMDVRGPNECELDPVEATRILEEFVAALAPPRAAHPETD